ncbi:hypothetical protein PHLGIDRAFT_123675 [Phlebiopsis gigantea 11061_1 CR5-6]|uniref:Secreted protein n=1 Tax=Phlebiopsis gigantea (strain 11061_1 CR5-6) TaxID=745531 RepID=A0A0C3N9B7_PHLG1|nr:hypothetical protein PHLGIDRAFT_123675 [Phlebiopsis gigantea 11061_1 CR5-6]
MACRAALGSATTCCLFGCCVLSAKSTSSRALRVFELWTSSSLGSIRKPRKATQHAGFYIAFVALRTSGAEIRTF